MKNLDFNPHKSQEDFRKNYKLHDKAEVCGKNLLIQWGFKFAEFGLDKRFEKLWEKGADKPDLIISYKGRRALLDWKAKRKPVWLVNQRALQSYINWENKLRIPVMICFAILDEDDVLSDFKFAVPTMHRYSVSDNKEWDLNSTMVFEQHIPDFTKSEVIKFLRR